MRNKHQHYFTINSIGQHWPLVVCWWSKEHENRSISDTFQALEPKSFFSINWNTERAGKSRSYFYFRFRRSDDVIRNEIFVSPKVFNYSISHHNFIKINDELMFKNNLAVSKQYFRCSGCWYGRSEYFCCKLCLLKQDGGQTVAILQLFDFLSQVA